MNSTPQVIAWVVANVSDWSKSDGEIADLLNAPTVDNPSPQPTIAIPMTVPRLMACVVDGSNNPDPAALDKIRTSAGVVAFRDDVVNQNKDGVKGWIGLAVGSGAITPTQYAAMLAVVNATEPDPSWPAKIGIAEAALGRPVNPVDIHESRPAQ